MPAVGHTLTAPPKTTAHDTSTPALTAKNCSQRRTLTPSLQVWSTQTFVYLGMLSTRTGRTEVARRPGSHVRASRKPRGIEGISSAMNRPIVSKC